MSECSITVHLATDGSGDPVSTANEVIAAVRAHPQANELIIIENVAGSDGTGIVPVMGPFVLWGGGAAPPAPPNTPGDGGVDFTGGGTRAMSRFEDEPNNFGMYLGQGGSVSSSSFRRMDRATALTTAISTIPSTLNGMCFHPLTGQLYAVTGNFGTIPLHLIRIDPATGAWADVGAMAPPQSGSSNFFYDISFSPGGTLYGKNASFNRLCSIDTATAVITVIGTQSPATHQTAFEIDGNTGIAYDARLNNTALNTVDLATGALTPVVTLNGGPVTAGQGTIPAMSIHPDGTMYAVLSSSTNRYLVTINRSTGLITSVGLLPAGTTWESLANKPRTLAQLKADRRGAGVSPFTVRGLTQIYQRRGTGAAGFVGSGPVEKSVSRYGTGRAPLSGTAAREGGTVPYPAPAFYLTSAGYPGETSDLWRLDRDTGATVSVGPIGYAVTGIAFDPVTPYKLYGVTSGNSAVAPRHLIKIDPESGVSQLIGELLISGEGAGSGHAVPDIAFHSNGQLYGWNQSSPSRGRLCSIDKATGQIAPIGASDLGTFGDAMAFDQSDVLYVMAKGDTGKLWTVNVTTGAKTDVATLSGSPGSAGSPINAGEFHPDGTLYAIVNSGFGVTQYLVKVNKTTAVITSVGVTRADASGLAVWPPTEALLKGDRRGTGKVGFTGGALREGGTEPDIPDPGNWALRIDTFPGGTSPIWGYNFADLAASTGVSEIYTYFRFRLPQAFANDLDEGDFVNSIYWDWGGLDLVYRNATDSFEAGAGNGEPLGDLRLQPDRWYAIELHGWVDALGWYEEWRVDGVPYGPFFESSPGANNFGIYNSMLYYPTFDSQSTNGYSLFDNFLNGTDTWISQVGTVDAGEDWEDGDTVPSAPGGGDMAGDFWLNGNSSAYMSVVAPP